MRVNHDSELIPVGARHLVGILLDRAGMGSTRPAGILGSMHGITVNGQGAASGIPDIAHISVGVSVIRASVADASFQAGAAAQAVLAAFSAAGVADSDLQTKHYSIAPEWDHRGEVPRLTGYRVDNTVMVQVRDTVRVAALIDEAVSAGGDAVRVHGVEFSLSDGRELAAAAREAAWHDAASKGAHLAALAGVELGAPVHIEETVGHVPGPVMRTAAMERSGTPLASGEHTTHVTLTVTFGIAAGP